MPFYFNASKPSINYKDTPKTLPFFIARHNYLSTLKTHLFTKTLKSILIVFFKKSRKSKFDDFSVWH